MTSPVHSKEDIKRILNVFTKVIIVGGTLYKVGKAAIESILQNKANADSVAAEEMEKRSEINAQEVAGKEMAESLRILREVDRLVSLGSEAYDSLRFEESLNSYNVALMLIQQKQEETPSASYEIYFGRGLAYLALERFQDAINDFSSSLRIRKNDPASLYFRGTTLMHGGLVLVGPPQRAPLDDFRAAAQRDKTNLILQGKICFLENKWQEAKNHFQNWLSCSRGKDAYLKADLYELLGRTESSLEEHENALASYRNGLECMDNIPSNHFRRIRLQEALHAEENTIVRLRTLRSRRNAGMV